jgi:hypothetical protein
MFEFTREFILNDIKDVKMQGSVLCVPKMINIEKSKVHSVHYAPYHPAVNEVVTVPVNGLAGALTITIGQEGRVISLVSSRDAENQKDYIFNGTPDDWARQFARQAAMEDMDRLIDIEFTKDTDGVITNMVIKALDCYTRVLKVTLVADKVEDGKVTGEEVKEWSRKVYWQNKALDIKAPQKLNATFVPGTEGMGTVARLQKNNRVLTAANITPYGFDRDERPMPGGKYDQFTIQYVSERRHQTAGVFGAIDHSLVTLVFFVPATLINSVENGKKTFKALLEDLVGASNICLVGNLEEGYEAEDGIATDELLAGDQETAAKNVKEDDPVVEAKEEIVPSKKHKE